MFSCAWTNIYDPVCVTDHVEIMLHHEKRIACRAQPLKRHKQRFGVCWMQARGGFIKYIDHSK